MIGYSFKLSEKKFDALDLHDVFVLAISKNSEKISCQRKHFFIQSIIIIYLLELIESYCVASLLNSETDRGELHIIEQSTVI